MFRGFKSSVFKSSFIFSALSILLGVVIRQNCLPEKLSKEMKQIRERVKVKVWFNGRSNEWKVQQVEKYISIRVNSLTCSK